MKKYLIIIAILLTSFAVARTNNYNNYSIKSSQYQFSGGIGYSEAKNGIIEKLYLNAMPYTQMTVELKSGNFLDCGYGVIVRQVDNSGRQEISLNCGVAITETVFVPVSSTPAEAIIHF